MFPGWRLKTIHNHSILEDVTIIIIFFHTILEKHPSYLDKLEGVACLLFQDIIPATQHLGWIQKIAEEFGAKNKKKKRLKGFYIVHYCWSLLKWNTDWKCMKPGTWLRIRKPGTVSWQNSFEHVPSKFISLGNGFTMLAKVGPRKVADNDCTVLSSDWDVKWCPCKLLQIPSHSSKAYILMLRKALHASWLPQSAAGFLLAWKVSEKDKVINGWKWKKAQLSARDKRYKWSAEPLFFILYFPIRIPNLHNIMKM